MSSHVGWMAAESIGRPIGSAIEKGKPLALVVGALIGTGIPLGLCYLLSASSWGYYIGFGLMGTIAGALVGAMLFPAPEKAVPDYSWIGETVFGWVTTIPGKTSTSYNFFALTQFALIQLYKEVGLGDSTPSWGDDLERIRWGEKAESPVVNAQRLSELRAVETQAKSQFVTLLWHAERGTEKTAIEFPSVDHRTAFLNEL